jgi:hypothetical protein
MTSPAMLPRRTEPKARKRVLERAPTFVGSLKMASKLVQPVILNEPMPVQLVKAKNPPIPVAT